MGRGILGPVVEKVPMPDGQAMRLRDATRVEGANCEIHDKKPEEVLPVFMELMRRPQGLDACSPCLERFIAYAKAVRGRKG